MFRMGAAESGSQLGLNLQTLATLQLPLKLQLLQLRANREWSSSCRLCNHRGPGTPHLAGGDVQIWGAVWVHGAAGNGRVPRAEVSGDRTLSSAAGFAPPFVPTDRGGDPPAPLLVSPGCGVR